MEREKVLAKNTIILAIGYVVPFITNLLLLPLITKNITQTEYGIYDLMTIIVSLLITISTLQIKQAAMRYLIDNRNNEKESSIIVSNALAFIFVSIAIVYILTCFIMRNNTIVSGYLVGLFFCIQIAFDTIEQLARGLGKNKEYVLGISLQAGLNLLFVIFFIVIFNNGLNGLLISNILAYLCAGFIVICKVSLIKYINKSLVSITKIIELLKFSTPIVFSSISIWIVKLSDRFVITLFMGAYYNGIYAVANKIPSLLSQVFDVFNMAWQENASLTVYDKDSQDYYSTIFRMVYNVLIGMACILLVATPILFKILVDDSYISAYEQIFILIIAMFFASLNGYFGNIYFAIGKPSINAYSTFCGAVINFVINMLFINKIGLYAASISTLISYVTLVIIRMIVLRKWNKIKYNYAEIILKFMILICLLMLIKNRKIFGSVCAIIYSILINKSMICSILNILKRMKGR